MSIKTLPFAAVLLLVTVAAADDKKPAAAKNLVVNGDGEAVADGKPAKWAASTAAGGKVELASSTDRPKEGKRCLHLTGNAEWAVAYTEKVPLDRKKAYTLTGYARAKTGTAQIKFDYFKGDEYLGMTASGDVTGDAWEQLTVTAEPDQFPEATHILAVAVAIGEFETWYDDLVLTAKEGK